AVQYRGSCYRRIARTATTGSGARSGFSHKLFSSATGSKAEALRRRPAVRGSEAIADRERCVGIAMVLADEVGHVAADPGDARRRAPMLAVGLGIFETREGSSAAHCGLNRKAAVRIDGPCGLPDEASRESPIRS